MANSSPTVAVKSLRDESSIDDRSRNVLVALDGSDVDDRLVHEAGTYAAGTGGRLVLLDVMSSDEFADRQRASARIDPLPRYTIDQAEEARRRTGDRIGRRTLDPLGIDYTAVGMVGREADQVLTAARAYDCGHVFLAARPQSVLRRLVTADLARLVARRFDGLVTVLQTERDRATVLERFSSPA